MEKVTNLFKPRLVETPKEIQPKHFYTVINIYTEDKANIKTAYMIARALGKICKIQSLYLVDGESINVSCRLNQYGLNCNEKIQPEFRDKIIKTVIKLLGVVDIDRYEINISRCVKGTKEITDEFSINARR